MRIAAHEYRHIDDIYNEYKHNYPYLMAEYECGDNYLTVSRFLLYHAEAVLRAHPHMRNYYAVE
jgi:hypothetical protein